MKFCPKCKGILLPKKEDNKTFLYCPKCGYKEESEGFKLQSKSKEDKDKASFEVVDEKLNDDLLPTEQIKCPKCGHNEAGYWTLQTRSSDEPETKFYRCKKCKHTWRDYT